VGNLAEPLEVGVVGLGYWGPNRLRALNELVGVHAGAICDTSAERLELAGRRHPGARRYEDFDAILEDPGLDAVIIATPADSHFELASKALRAGKHTFVEKPLCASSGEAVELAALAEEVGLTLMCGHTFVYSPPVRVVKALIDSGELGELYFISSSRVNLGPYRSDVSVVWDLAPHDLSILLYWLDRSPASVSAVGRDVISPGTEDVAFVDLVYDDGLLAHLELSWLAPSKLRRTVVVGSEKMVVYEDGSHEPVRIFDSGIDYQDPKTFGEYQLSYRSGDILSPRVETTEPIVAELDDFFDAVRTGAAPESRAGLAIEVIRLVEATQESIQAGGDRVAIETAPGARRG
jgi:predicted dehydrogenase